MNTKAIITMVSVFAGAVYGVIQILESSLFKPKKVLPNIEIVLDRSDSMNESFDGSTKWQAAASAVKESLVLVAESDNLVLRIFGGKCNDKENTRCLVWFAKNNEDKILNKLNKLEHIDPTGETTLAKAVVEATGDLEDFGGSGSKSIIVITCGSDSCHDDFTQVIRKRLDMIDTEIKLHFRFIGMGLTTEQKADLNIIAKEIDGKASFPDDREQLKHDFGRSLAEAHTLYSDDFSDPFTIAANWEIHDAKNPASGPSNWIIKDGQLFQTSNIYRSGPDEYDFYEGTHIVTKRGTDWTDYKISVDFHIDGDDDGVGIVFRYRDAEHYYRFITVEDSSNRGPFRRLQVKDGDKFITLAESKEGYDRSTTHNVEVSIVGNQIVVFFDGQQILSAKDARYKSGRVGLQAYAEQPYFDNFIVSSIMGTKRAIESEETDDTTPPEPPKGFRIE